MPCCLSNFCIQIPETATAPEDETGILNGVIGAQNEALEAQENGRKLQGVAEGETI